MKILRWLRHKMALFIVMRQEEIGGILYDYDNGRWKLLLKWSGYDDAAALEVVNNMFNSGKDAIYISVVRTEAKSGYMVAVDSNRDMYYRAFIPDVYDPNEAVYDINEYCRKIADGMGFRRPENTEGVQS